MTIHGPTPGVRKASCRRQITTSRGRDWFFFSEAMKIPSLFAGAIKATQREATAYGCERMDPSRNIVLIIDSRNRLPREA